MTETTTPASEKKEAWIQELDQLVDSLDPKEAEEAFQDFDAFLDGEATWAEVQGVPKQVLLEMAEKAYLKFEGGRLSDAEQLFKGLVILDHHTAYYHTALGAIYQQQKKYLEALSEYTVAIEVDPEDITAYTNRAEVYLQLDKENQAVSDLEAAIRLDPKGENPWTQRAQLLKKQILSKKDAS